MQRKTDHAGARNQAENLVTVGIDMGSDLWGMGINRWDTGKCSCHKCEGKTKDEEAYRKIGELVKRCGRVGGVLRGREERVHSREGDKEARGGGRSDSCKPTGVSCEIREAESRIPVPGLQEIHRKYRIQPSGPEAHPGCRGTAAVYGRQGFFDSA